MYAILAPSSLLYFHYYLYFIVLHLPSLFSLFFFNDTATTEIYTLSLHDALPIYPAGAGRALLQAAAVVIHLHGILEGQDRKSTRLNSSHVEISYAVFCLKKKKKKKIKKK